MAEFAGANSDGVAFLVSAGIVYEIIAAACSSPQTMEINAAARAGTLMKWVHVGIVQAAAFVAIAAYIDRRHRVAIVAGGGLAGGLMYGQYVHAKRSGLASSEPPTETYSGGWGMGRGPRWGVAAA